MRETLEIFEETLEEWCNCEIMYEYQEEELVHIKDKLFIGDAIRWYEGLISTDDLIRDWKV